MYCLKEDTVRDDPARLDQAWLGAQTFSFVPDRSGVSHEWLKRAMSQLPCELQTGHFALLTSGTTGDPKLVIGSRVRAQRLVEVLHHLQGSEPVGEAILTLPLTYSYALVNQWLWARCYGRRLVVTRGLGQPDALRAALRRADQAMLCLVGVQVPLMVRYFPGESFPGMIRVHFAGGRFPQKELDTVRAFFPNAQIYNNFGCAEAMPRLTLRKAEDADEAADVGRPLPGVELRAGDGGRLLFRSRYGAVAMVDQHGARHFGPQDWVPTGDLGEPGERGTWRLTGRHSEVFKRHGEKISLAALLTSVERCWPGQAAFYREADRDGEDGHVLALAPRPAEDQLRTILISFRTSHSRAHWPLRIESIEALPLLPNGKVDLPAVTRTESRTVHWHQRI